MDFGAFWSAGFYAIRDLDEEDSGANYIRGVFFTNSMKHLSVSNN